MDSLAPSFPAQRISMPLGHSLSWPKFRRLAQPAGFTLVELLVVIGVIGVLVSLLLPAVQSAREAARAIQCKNNLKQLALAIATYESLTKRLPASGFLRDSNPNSAGPLNFQLTSVNEDGIGKFSWLIALLPQLEQQALYAQFDFKMSPFKQTGDPQATHLAGFRCPSDGAQREFFMQSLTRNRPFAKGNYAAYVSPTHLDLQRTFPGALVDVPQPLAHVTDGTSQTLALAEIRVRSNPRDQRGAWALPWTGACLLAFDAHHNYLSPQGETPGVFVFNEGSRYQTQRPNGDGPNTDTLYDCDNPAEAQFDGVPCLNNPGWLSASPRSRHPGGVFVAYLDGHVSRVTNAVDDRVMAYAISINDGQAISPQDLE